MEWSIINSNLFGSHVKPSNCYLRITTESLAQINRKKLRIYTSIQVIYKADYMSAVDVECLSDEAADPKRYGA